MMMKCVCGVCGCSFNCTNPIPICTCTECVNIFPFNHFEEEDDFRLNLLSFFSLNKDVNMERLKYMKINPFHLNNIDDIFDNDILDNIKNSDSVFKQTQCKYIFSDELNKQIPNDNSFSLIHFNARSLPKNYDDIHTLLASLEKKFTAIGISETWLSVNKKSDMYHIDGYNFVQINRENKRGGGVGIYIDNNFDYLIRSDISNNTSEFQSIFIELLSNEKRCIIIGCIYRVPGSNIDTFLDKLNNILEKINNRNSDIFIMGDFNLNLLNIDSHDKTNEFLESMYSSSLYPLISKPSRITPNSATLIDNIFCNCLDSTFNTGLLIADVSDHLPVFCVKKNCKLRSLYDNPYVSKRLINDKLILKFKSKLQDTDWTILYRIDDINTCYNKFLKIYCSIYNECFPLVKPKQKPKHIRKKPWITKALLHSINKKQRLWKNYLKKPTHDNEAKYKRYKNNLIHLLRVAKADYYSSVFSKIKYDTKKVWGEINSILGNRKHKKLPSVMYNGNLKLHSSKDIIEEFNNYFLSIGKNIAESIHTDKSFDCYLPVNRTLNSLFLNPTSVHEIIKTISSIKLSKSTDPDEISSRIVKCSTHYIAEPLCYIINKSICCGVVPDKLKLSKVVPIYKKGDANDISNYRPIAILPVFSKIMEKIIYCRLYKFLQVNNILIDEQFGFRKQFSTDLAIFNLSHCIQGEMEKCNYSIGIFMDLSKAFDTIDHHILLKKLQHYGIRGIAYDWFVSYLKDRQQYVMVDGVKSSVKNIEHGIPQGSVLGPLLFLVYINDIINSSNYFKFSLFADDTVAIISQKNLNTLYLSANREMTNVSLWFKANKLALNLTKTNYILFRSRKRRVPLTLPPLFIDDVPISQLHDVKFLGVIINEYLDWAPHISALSKSIARSVGILRKLKFVLPCNVLKIIYYALIHSYMNYCNHVWGNTYISHLSKIHILQKKSMRIISKSNMNSSSGPLFKKLNILPIQKMIVLNSLIFMYLIKNKMFPEKYCNIFVQNFNVHSYSTRQTKHFHLPKLRLTSSLNSLSYTGIKYWNNLNNSIQESTTLSRFKKICKTQLFQE